MLEVSERRSIMTALARKPAQAPQPRPERSRHLRVLPPPQRPADEGARQLRETRWTAALLLLATVVLIALWAAALAGAADEAWWPPLFAVAFAGVVGFALVVLRKTR
jgi:hypothetical protein